MEHESGLVMILALLVAGVGLATLFRRAGLPVLTGYLAAGLALGPYGFTVINDPHSVAVLGEFGVIFLLFAIGIDLPVKRLKAMRQLIFGLGAAQVVVTALVLGGLLMLAGFSAPIALVLGGALAMSSTAACMRLLAERKETLSAHGRAALAVLLFQDLAVVPLLALVEQIGGSGPLGPPSLAGLAISLGKGAAAITAIILFGNVLLRPVLRIVAATRIPELFTGASLVIVLIMAMLATYAGLSMALGAFLGGLALAGTPYRHQIEADLEPFRGLLLGLFFMTIGMTLDPAPLLHEPLLVVACAVALIAVKAVVLTGVGRLFGLDLGAALRIGGLLAQGSEFSFVVAARAGALGMIDGETASLLTLTVAISLGVTPLVAHLGHHLGRHFDHKRAPKPGDTEHSHTSHPVIIAGFGRVGRTIADILTAQGRDFVAIDLDARTIAEARAQGYPAYFGDCRLGSVLRSAGIERARLMVIALDDPKSAEACLAAIRHEAPQLPVVARARDPQAAQHLRTAGAADVVAETIEASLQLAGFALRHSGMDADEATIAIDAARIGPAVQPAAHPV